MLKFKHSGSFSDIIYSLPFVRMLGGGDLMIYLNNLDRSLREHGYTPDSIDSSYRGRFTREDFDFIEPLLTRQPYINNAYVFDGYQHDYDLDMCKGFLYKRFRGNAVESYYKYFDHPYTPYQVVQPWLSADNITEAPVIINRTMRYRSRRSDCQEIWNNINDRVNFKNNAYFVGTKQEHADFCDMGFELTYRPVDNAFEMANLIAGANLFIGNQGFAYSLAQGLGRPVICETHGSVLLEENECYFKHQSAEYF